ncbi:MAG: hypothetical protein A2521_10655 [Deltaproteobacteria bacterium RIFOXYD12_FULL_57_12]|nr:MAG: hypothetical protein A2521_10655 [Deltaproteobacteria bacterium RIFOXYD12_FULL_57_12]
MDKEKIRKSVEDFLENKIAALSRQALIGIYAVAFILPVGAFYYFVFSPKSVEIKGLQGQQATLEAELAEVKAAAANLEKHKAQMAETEEQLKQASVLLPLRKDIPTLLTNISSLGTNAGLDFLAFTPQAEKPQDFYMEVPVSISVRGPYHNVGSFLYEVSKLDRIVSAFDLTMGGATLQNGEMILNTTLNLITYRFIEAAEKNETAKK